MTGAASEFVLDASLRSAWLPSVERFPDRPAVVLEGKTLTYAELDAEARQIAACILDRLARPAIRVGVFASRSLTAYAGVISSLFAGGGFVPLNRRFPVQRTAAMIRRAQLDALIVDEVSASQLGELAALVSLPPIIIAHEENAHRTLRSMGLDVVGPDELRRVEPLGGLPAVEATDLAYLLFTSGSTGEPKGVGVTHANALHYVRTMSARCGLSPLDRCSQTFELTFDLSVHDMFVTWERGAALFVPRQIDLLAPVRFANKHDLTVWFSVPSVAALAQKNGMLRASAMPSVRLSLFCGEPLPNALAAAWKHAAPRSTVHNLYGPTELTIACFAHEWQYDAEALNGIVPIGTPFDGLDIAVVDDDLTVVRQGEVGELLVSGPQTVPGYWMDAVRTEEKFVELTAASSEARRYYRTGDRVVRLESGNYAFVGRTDHQIKVRGFRVELGEVEAVLLGSTGVTQAVALGWPMVSGVADRIVAFVSGTEVDTTLVRDRAIERLPDYMVPERIILVDEFPSNSNGKVDRGKLAGLLADS